MHTIPLMDYRWDKNKAEANHLKHGVDFADSALALEDSLALTIPDPDSTGESRFISLGMDPLGRVLVTAFAYRDDHVRIISSRIASRGERRKYEEA